MRPEKIYLIHSTVDDTQFGGFTKGQARNTLAEIKSAYIDAGMLVRGSVHRDDRIEVRRDKSDRSYNFAFWWVVVTEPAIIAQWVDKNGDVIS